MNNYYNKYIKYKTKYINKLNKIKLYGGNEELFKKEVEKCKYFSDLTLYNILQFDDFVKSFIISEFLSDVYNIIKILNNDNKNTIILLINSFKFFDIENNTKPFIIKYKYTKEEKNNIYLNTFVHIEEIKIKQFIQDIINILYDILLPKLLIIIKVILDNKINNDYNVFKLNNGLKTFFNKILNDLKIKSYINEKNFEEIYNQINEIMK